MIIRNASVFTGEHRFEEHELHIKGERIAESSGVADETDILDATGLIAIPGLVDIHFHGAAGHDLCDEDEESLRAIAEYEASRGVLAICPATMTLPGEKLLAVMESARRYVESRQTSTGAALCESPVAPNDFGAAFSESPVASDGSAADLVGIHLEGPFLSADKLGAQNPAYLALPDATFVRELDERSGGLIKIVDVAPELPGALEFIRELAGDYRISLAHTNADYETAKAAFSAGACHLTHLYNAMPGLHHRDPGPIAAAAEINRTSGRSAGAQAAEPISGLSPEPNAETVSGPSRPIEAELITDGIHVHPSMVRLAFSLFGADRMILISDSMEATGLPDGAYSLGGLAVTKTGNRAVLTDSPSTIAGSVTDLFSCMKEAIRMGIPAEQAIAAATENPARSIGIDADYGSLEPGHYANVLLVNSDFELVHVIHKGRLIR